jgi:hypothetical protein
VVAFGLGFAPLLAAAATVEPMQVVSTPDAYFISGGVGAHERADLRADAPQYNLRVSFARRSDGAFLSHVDVVLEGKQLAQRIELTTAGPVLLVEVPAGEYTLSASLDGWQTARRHVSVAGGKLDKLYVTLERPSTKGP